MRIDNTILHRIENIHWLYNCGNPINKAIFFDFCYAKDWEEAKESYRDSVWENTTLEARNQLSSFLYKRYLTQFSEWNKISKEARAFVDAKVVPNLTSVKGNFSIDDKFIQLIRWDILHAIMEHTYTECKNTPIFYLHLLDIYEQGNIPCGWRGLYPNGELIVF